MDENTIEEIKKLSNFYIKQVRGDITDAESVVKEALAPCHLQVRDAFDHLCHIFKDGNNSETSHHLKESTAHLRRAGTEAWEWVALESSKELDEAIDSLMTLNTTRTTEELQKCHDARKKVISHISEGRKNKANNYSSAVENFRIAYEIIQNTIDSIRLTELKIESESLLNEVKKTGILKEKIKTLEKKLKN